MGKHDQPPEKSPAIICRAARMADLDALVALEENAFSGNRISRRQMKFHITNPKTRLWVCLDNARRPAAYLMGFFHQGRAPRLYSLATRADMRGRGLGSRLIKRFIREARSCGVSSILLEVRADAPATITLYQRLGFNVVRRLPGYYIDGGDGYKMMMKL